MPMACPCICTLDDVTSRAFSEQQDGALELAFEAQAGLYQFSVIVDASQVDWEELYITVTRHGVVDARTGPWDFDWKNDNKPLVPSYWVEVNGKRLGLWFFQRVSLEDIEAKRFRGHVAFHIPASGPSKLRLVPYRPMPISWISARLEVDPDDHLQPLPPAQAPYATLDWSALRERLSTTHQIYAEPLSRGYAWALSKANSPIRLRLLLAAWKIDGNLEARDKALATIDDAIALPYWGNPATDGYSHNGDMNAAFFLRSLAWALHDFADVLGAERTQKLKAKLALQGQCFFEQALLNRDYWGGSLLQDHGWTSNYAFAVAAIVLRGSLPEAELWCAYAIPRARRSLASMPRDGVIPPSSYCSVYMYTDELIHFRDALLTHTGEDVFDSYPLHGIVDYLIAVLRPEEQTMVFSTSTGGDALNYIGGAAFLNRIASKYRDRRSATLARLLLDRRQDTFYHPSEECAYYVSFIRGFLTLDSQVEPLAQLPDPPVFAVFEDSGLAHYRDPRTDVTLSVQCGPWCGHHAYRSAKGPCDRMEMAPGAGHFNIALGNQPLLVTPDFGYRLITGLRTCMLIDGHGQNGDVGYPMSIPSKRYYGDEIESTHWDESTGHGLIRLDLAPAYPSDLGLICYTREFIFGAKRGLICRDTVVLREPRQLAWLFQGKREFGVALDGLQASFGTERTLHLSPSHDTLPLTASVHQTDVVWSYCSASGFKPFDHVRYETTEPISYTAIDFHFTW